MTAILSGTAEAEVHGPTVAAFRGMSADGSVVAFSTEERMARADTVFAEDIYVREGNSTTLVTEPGGDPWQPPADRFQFAGISADGSRIIFQTKRRLVGEDDDELADLYQWTHNNGVDLISAGTKNNAGNSNYVGIPSWLPYDAGFGTEDRGGTSIVAPSADDPLLFTISDDLVPADDDRRTDLYVSQEGQVRLLTKEGDGTARQPMELVSAAFDHSVALIETTERFSDLDEDDAEDLYLIGVDGGIELVGGSGTPGTVWPRGLSLDGEMVVFETEAPLVSTDYNSHRDIYRWENGEVTLISSGMHNYTFDRFQGMTPDSSRIFFNTDVRLASEVEDGYHPDLFMGDAGGITWISTGGYTRAENGIHPPYDAIRLAGATPDASKVLFQSEQPHQDAEIDDKHPDLYLWEQGQITSLTPEVDDYYPAAVTPDLSRFVFGERIRGTNAAGEQGIFEWVDGEVRLTPFLTRPDRFEVETWFNPIYSRDGETLALSAAFGMVSGDQDGAFDVYTISRDGQAELQSVDEVSPVTEIKKVKVDERVLNARFRSGERGLRYKCRIDNGGWRACTPKKSLGRQDVGRHRLAVRAIDESRNRDKTPASVKFKIRR